MNINYPYCLRYKNSSLNNDCVIRVHLLRKKCLSLIDSSGESHPILHYLSVSFLLGVSSNHIETSRFGTMKLRQKACNYFPCVEEGERMRAY